MNLKRPHHQRIAQVLSALDGPLLKEHNCLFGGGTAIALMYGEYRESVDMDFMISELSSYQKLRSLLRSEKGIAAIMTAKSPNVTQMTDIRADQYGIRTKLEVAGQPIKFEIVLEGRIKLSDSGINDEILGIATLTKIDMAASKLLANSDRWADASVHSRDVIDLAIISLKKPLLKKAIEKAQAAYGQAILMDVGKAINQLQERDGWLESCMTAMEITMPRAILWQSISKLRQDLLS